MIKLNHNEFDIFNSVKHVCGLKSDIVCTGILGSCNFYSFTTFAVTQDS